MRAEAIPTDHQLRRAARLLRAGSILAYPTEGVFGLGCDPDQPAALRRLLALKGRRVDKGLILLAANMSQLSRFMALLTPAQRERLIASWPGPVTWIVPARPGLDPLLTGGRTTLAMRVTAHGPARALCRAFGGAIVSTSANRSGHPPARSRLAVQRTLGPLPCLPGRLGDLAGPTAIFDLTSGRCLRPGPSKEAS
ncbi:MAG TPA: Sua5/YciO/YrdC/YwlC family protein [Candidatus Macondimonas sp.]|nr:Sua5/YciO/YrdC/YwlC family protein [Candidatus Macondimonas sp.]